MSTTERPRPVEAFPQNVFWGTLIDGREPADVAEELHVTRHVVYKAESRGLWRLRQELEGLDIWD